MTTSALTAPAAALKKNVEARGTGSILNVVSWIGVAFFVLAAPVDVIVVLVAMAHGETYAALFGILGLGFLVVFGALFFATVGWYCDKAAKIEWKTLSLSKS